MIKGYKVTNPDYTCQGFKFEIGVKYHQEGEIVLCSNGFHFCEKPNICFNYYSFDPENHVFEIEADGIVLSNPEDKSVSENITLIRELTWEEVLKVSNIGHRNTGHSNTGDWNTGNWNTGHSNTGNWNTGHSNTGNWNTGDRNTGDRNTGDWNTGDWNTGDWNTGNWNTGFFNTNKPKQNRFFNKNTEKENVYFPEFLYFNLTVWVSHDMASQEEKEKHKKEIECMGGFLKKLDYKDAFLLSWKKADKQDRIRIKELPNFNKKIFKEISGIDIDKD